MERKSFKWHPQPSSIRKALGAAKRFDIRNKKVLDCFCGVGAHCIAAISAGASTFTGTDIENYSWCLRVDAFKYNQTYDTLFNAPRAIRFEWGIDAKESITTHEFDILFIDPPNPYQIVGGAPLSMCRDTGLSGNELTKYWKSRFDSNNIINKRDDTIAYVKDIISKVRNDNKRILANLFVIKSNKFDYSTHFSEFEIKRVFESYYEVI
jgi:16S rRNA G966 N2-methylase RsmD